MNPEHKHLLANTPRLLDVLLDSLKAYEAAGSADDANVPAVFHTIMALYAVQPALFAFSDVNRLALRGAASSIRFAIDHPLDLAKEIGATTNMISVRWTAAVSA